MLTNKKDIDAWCKAMGILNYLIYDDLNIKVFEDVDISNKKLTHLPVKFLETTGNFNCSNNNLISLKNVPEIVGGIFNCSANKLNSLEHSPQIVKSDFDCSQNKITSLEYISNSVGGDLKISNNPIKKIDYCPTIGYSLLCANCELTSFDGFPKKIRGTLNCNENNIGSFDNCPTHIGLHFFLSCNPISSFKNAPQKIGGDFIFGFIDRNKQDLNKDKLIVDFDLSKINISESLIHNTTKKENFISGFENFYSWKNKRAFLHLKTEQIKSINLNSKLENELVDINPVKKNKSHKI